MQECGYEYLHEDEDVNSVSSEEFGLRRQPPRL